MSRLSASAHRIIPGPEPVRLGANAVTRRRRTEQARELVGHGHSVQFYEDDRFLLETVVDFFAVGLVDGLGAVAIATREHLAAITQGLHEKGFDVERTCMNDVAHNVPEEVTRARVARCLRIARRVR